MKQWITHTHAPPGVPNYYLCCFHLCGVHGSRSLVVSGSQCLWLIHNNNEINVCERYFTFFVIKYTYIQMEVGPNVVCTCAVGAE